MVSNILQGQIQEDKKKHFIAGSTISGLTYMLAKNKLKDPNKALLCSIGAGILAGVAKETLDATQPGNTFDSKDLLATTAILVSLDLIRTTAVDLPCNKTGTGTYLHARC